MANKSKIKKANSKKSKSRSTEDESWILEGIVAYLRSPTWTVPVMNFVEENCGTFVNSEENKLEYMDIQRNYKKLVERLLVCYMRELNLTEKQFSQVCSRENKDIPKMDENFQYIWAADDFLLFKRLMLQKNLKVEMEALHMLESQNLGTIGKDGKFTEADEQFLIEMQRNFMDSGRKFEECGRREEEDFKLAVEFSKLEMERLNALADEEKKLIEQAIKLSLENSPGTQSILSDDKFIQSGAEYTSALTQPVVIESQSHGKPPDFSSTSLVAPPTYQKPSTDEVGKVSYNPKAIHHQTVEKSELPPVTTPKSNSQAAADWLNDAMKEITESPTHAVLKMSKNTSQDTIDPEKMAKRRAYLQAQREKLLKIKKKEREKELLDYNEQKQDSQTSSSQDTKVLDPEEEKKLASRRAVAQRLKEEVIHKN